MEILMYIFFALEGEKQAKRKNINSEVIFFSKKHQPVLNLLKTKIGLPRVVVIRLYAIF
ncbi:hypothetical protein M2451_003786 [Dysgonomonas sp. PFB1-18]|nr:hypothetical protein [Dysgonomonas sp. PF1-14]MDH6340863.1 hypothetical protein [Dysgonomonas sp. PF1-16]MDH6382445.1 hypothetical protein [Dysgonomonas sp. PFB1-18]MDH6399794.1 hypothetical protein [Dysgonomonas sp. PF1-23]